MDGLKAPACFAAASVFAHDSEVCRRCQAFGSCADASLQTLEKIKGIINVQDLLKRHEKARKASQTAKPTQATPTCSPLPQKQVERKTQVAQVKFDISVNDDEVIATLPTKPKALAISLCKAGLIDKARKELASGINPFAERGPGFLRVAFSLLIKQGFTRKALREALQDQLGWTESTAMSHASIAVALLAAFNITQEIDGLVVLNPALS